MTLITVICFPYEQDPLTYYVLINTLVMLKTNKFFTIANYYLPEVQTS